MHFHDVVSLLDLSPHPEGGFYREVFRAPHRVKNARGSVRAAATSIYFLLPAGVFSAWHKVDADETWHFYEGAAIELYTLDAAGTAVRTLLGRDLQAGHRPQHTVPAGVWQAARPLADAKGAYALCGCSVSPGFDFEDFVMPARDAMQATFPDASHELRRLIDAFTR